MRTARSLAILSVFVGFTWAVAAHSADDVTPKLKAALTESAGKLGALEPWQKKIFDEEAIPQYQRFIKDYRSNGSDVVADLDALRNYLRFYAPKSLKRENPRILVFLQPEASCEKCNESLLPIRRLVKARLERRGFVPVWATTDDIGDPKLAGADLDQKVIDLSAQKNTSAAISLRWQVAPIDDIDTAHADETRYRLHWLIQMPDLANIGAKDAVRNEADIELQPNDAFDVVAGRVMTDAFTDIGTKIEKALAVAQNESTHEEIALEVLGIQTPQQMAAFKARLVSALKDVKQVEERKIARGRVVFALFTDKTPEDVKVLLAAKNSEIMAGETKLTMEIK